MKFLVAFLVLIAVSLASAQTKLVSIDAFDLAYSGGFAFRHDNAKGSDRETNKFRINLNYAQNFEQYVGLMWKARVFFNREDTNFGKNDTLDSAIGATGGVLYNFQPEDIKNSLFVGAQAGLERASYKIGSSHDKSGFNLLLDFEAGKRWDMGQYSVANISYAPTIGLNFKRYGGGIRDDYFQNGYEIRFNFLKFDILF